MRPKPVGGMIQDTRVNREVIRMQDASQEGPVGAV